MRGAHKAYLPVARHSIFARHTSGMKGRGAGGVLLDGGRGGQSSYESYADYLATTKSGKGLGCGMKSPNDSLKKKLESLMPKPVERKNIKFSL